MSEPVVIKSSEDTGAMDRRRFVKTGTTSLAIAGVGACVFGFRYLSPNVLYEPSPVINVVEPEHYRAGHSVLSVPIPFTSSSACHLRAFSAAC